MGTKLILNKLVLRLIPSYVKGIIEAPYKNIISAKDNIIFYKEEEEKYINLSFSQEGEDLILFRLIGNVPHGYYVDIGAHHPLRFSNTYKFYKMGWHGINIDALPGSMKIFKEKRPNDINLEIAVSNNAKAVSKYYMFNEPALNTFNEEHALLVKQNNPEARIIKTIELPTCTLSNIFHKYLPEGQKIDFLNIDVEGFDLNVVESNDWNRFRPDYLVIESFSTQLENDLNSEISLKLLEYGYSLISKTVNSLIFKNEK